MNAHSYSLSLEHSIRNVFECERGGFGGIVDADSIECDWKVAIMATLGYIFSTANGIKRKAIEEFIVDNMFFLDIKLNELLQFETNQKVVEITTTTLDPYKNGKEVVEMIISKFSVLISEK